MAHTVLRKSVFIVEDNVLNMKLLDDVLTAHGYRTLSARDSYQALTHCREERPDTRATPIIAVTDCALRGDEEKVHVGGCDSYIAKPVPIDTLIAEVVGFIGSNTADPRAAIVS